MQSSSLRRNKFQPADSIRGPPPVCEGEYYFDVATGKLQAQDSSAEKMETFSGFMMYVSQLGFRPPVE